MHSSYITFLPEQYLIFTDSEHTSKLGRRYFMSAAGKGAGNADFNGMTCPVTQP